MKGLDLEEKISVNWIYLHSKNRLNQKCNVSCLEVTFAQ